MTSGTAGAAVRIVVPVLTLRTASGALDQGANAAYASSAAATWLEGFIVGGTLGGGEVMPRTERLTLIGQWLDHVPVDRVIGCTWNLDDVPAIRSLGARPMLVLHQLVADEDVLRVLEQLPTGAMIYSH